MPNGPRASILKNMGAAIEVSAYTAAPRRFVRRARLRCDPQGVFSYVSDIARLPEWLPGVRRATADNAAAETPGGLGAVRVLVAPFGIVVRERIVAWQAPHGFAYALQDSPLAPNHLAVVTVTAERGNTLIAFEEYYDVARFPLNLFAGAIVRRAVVGMVKNLVRRFGGEALA